jgi:hypothetical protein
MVLPRQPGGRTEEGYVRTDAGRVPIWDNHVAQHAPGTRVALTIQRNGQQRTLEMTVDEEEEVTPTEEPAQTALEELNPPWWT